MLGLWWPQLCAGSARRGHRSSGPARHRPLKPQDTGPADSLLHQALLASVRGQRACRLPLRSRHPCVEGGRPAFHHLQVRGGGRVQAHRLAPESAAPLQEPESPPGFRAGRPARLQFSCRGSEPGPSLGAGAAAGSTEDLAAHPPHPAGLAGSPRPVSAALAGGGCRAAGGALGPIMRPGL